MSRTESHVMEEREAPAAPQDFKTELLSLVPFLRAFARSLTGNYESADDLVQETMVKAWQSRDTFELGTNLKAWLFTILRNQFYSDRRRAWRQGRRGTRTRRSACLRHEPGPTLGGGPGATPRARSSFFRTSSARR